VIAVMETCLLKKLIQSTGKFISKDENRPQLHYIRLEFNKESNTVKAVALDGYKVSIQTEKCISVNEDFVAYIKPYLPPYASNQYAEIELKNEHCFITISDRLIGYKQDISNVIYNSIMQKLNELTEVTHELYVNADYLADALKSISKDKSGRRIVKMQLRGGIGPVSLETENGIRYVLPCRK
jgi:DNA polymerase III sliding clamp (beta) subunit (PCNA family)